MLIGTTVASPDRKSGRHDDDRTQFGDLWHAEIPKIANEHLTRARMKRKFLVQ